MNYAWPAAVAFVGMCAAIAHYNINAPQPLPKPKDAQIICMEQRGKWIGSGWGMSMGTCEYLPAQNK